MNFEIRLAYTEEKNEILDFIKNHWNKNHIYLKRIELFDYLHQGKTHLNVVIAKDISTNDILAIHAFIPYENFDNTFSYSSIFLSIWKVREDLNIAGLGLRTIKFIENNLEIKPILIQALGYAKEVSPLYEKLGYTIGKLSHYVLINTTLDSFEILEKGNSTNFLKEKKKQADDLHMKEIYKEDLINLNADKLNLLCEGLIPEKSKEFILAKYRDHPIYQYKYCLVLDEKNQYKLFFIYRKIRVKGSNILRIVDVLGSEQNFARIKDQLFKLITKNDSEYLDIYHFGLDNNSLINANFIDRYSTDGLIVPNYFEPFVRSNIDINYAFLTTGEVKNIKFFKGDGDQDRPSLV